ncbi:MAG: ABC-type dipeptide/oligopeptide/nickel transport system permease component [Myxococcota bacterium]|jgi:ABC-type dipeptide/oligopeptide/nickel transport system permease component
MRRVLERLLGATLAIAGAVTLVFFTLRATPGDPADNILGDEAPPAAKQAFRDRLHLDEPLFDQYGHLWNDILDGSLGHSYGISDRDETVAEVIGDVLPATIELALAAMLVALLIALPVGILAALNQGRLIDQLSMLAAMVGVAVPVFWLGPMLLFLLSVKIQLLPDPGAPLRGPWPLLLPAMVLGLALSAKLTRMVRASVLDVLREDYVTTARAKGLPEWRVVGKHVLRNALVPVLTVAGLQMAALLSGAIVTEKVFARPGIGTLLLDAIVKRDYAVVQGCVISVAVGYVLVNLLVDLLYIAIDPRVRRAHS